MASLTGYVLIDTAILIATLIFVSYKYFTRNFSYWKERNVPFLPPKVFFGNLEDSMKMKVTVIEDFYNIYNMIKEPFCGAFVIDRPVLIVKDPSVIKNILLKDFNNFSERHVSLDSSVDPISSNILFVSSYPEWHSMRSKTRQFFTPAKLKHTVGLITEVQTSLKTYLDENSDLPYIDAKKLASAFMVDVIGTCAYGIKANSFTEKNSEFKTRLTSVLAYSFRNALAQTVMFLIPHYAKLIRCKLMAGSEVEYFKNCFDTVMANRRDTKAMRNDFIDFLIRIQEVSEEENKFSYNQMIAQGFTFIFAAYETSSSIVGYLLYELCLQQDIQDKLREEISLTIEENEDLTFEVIHSMKYLQMCLSETLRKYPTLPYIDRKCTESFTIPGTKVVIEKDINVIIPLKGLHYDPQYFPEPEKFDPERFSIENIREMVPCTYLPFGDGPRNCIGDRFALTSMKMALITILMNFKVVRIDKTPVPIEFDTKTIVNGSKTGLPMKFQKLDLHD